MHYDSVFKVRENTHKHNVGERERERDRERVKERKTKILTKKNSVPVDNKNKS